MSETITTEFYFFLHAALTGVVLSAVYDIFRILRRVRSHGWFLIAVEDFFYWIGSALYIFFILMRDNDGVIRWFFVFGILMGMLVYNLTISQYLVKILSKIIKWILDIVEKILNIVFKPFAFLLGKSKKTIAKCRKLFIKILRFFKKALKKSWKTVKIGVSKK